MPWACALHGKIPLRLYLFVILQVVSVHYNLNLSFRRFNWNDYISNPFSPQGQTWFNLFLLFRHIFNEWDDPLLKYQMDDNQKIEPEWYMPIIPMVLVNGADGIGTGWSTKVPNYNPRYDKSLIPTFITCYWLPT